MEAVAAMSLLAGQQMAPREILHMDVVAHAGAIGRGVVVAEYMQGLAPAHCHLGDIGHQVVGHAAGIFTDGAAGVGTDRIEVAQGGQ